jgi:hypothetical protein
MAPRLKFRSSVLAPTPSASAVSLSRTSSKADLVHQCPRFQVLLIGAGGNLWAKVAFRQGPGQFLALLEMIQMFGIGRQIKRKDFRETLQACVPASCNRGIVPQLPQASVS